MIKRIVIILILIALFPLVVFLSSGKLPSFSKPPFFVSSQKDQPKDTEIVSGPISIHHWKTKNGTPVYFIPTEKLPMVDIKVTFDAGSARDGKKFGLSTLHSTMLEEGTEKHTASQIARRFEDVGAVFDTDTQKDRKSIKLRSITEPETLLPVVDMFTEILAQPAFPETALEQLKNRTLVALESDLQYPDVIALVNFYKAVYGDHPYGHLVSGTIAGINSITRQDLIDFHKQFMVVNNAVITIVGGLHRDYAREISEQIANALPTGKAATPLPDVAPLKEAAEIYLPMNSQQTHVLLGAPCCTYNDPDFFPILVGNYILGEGPLVARLFKELRDKRGLVYTVGSRFNRLKKPGVFVITLQTQKNQAQDAIKILKDTLSQFITEGPTEEEVTAAKKGIIGGFPLSIGSNARVAEVISDMSFYDMPMDFLNTFQHNVEKVTRADIQSAFRRRVDPNTLVLVVVGEKKP